MEVVSENRCFGGTQGVYRHRSQCCGCDMTFGLFLPGGDRGDRGPATGNSGHGNAERGNSNDGQAPALWYLSGLTCTHENAMVKAGAQKTASRLGVALIFPDTSPRGDGVADDDAYDLGQGAGFYVDATEEPWAANYRMWTYVTEELPGLVFDRFPLDSGRQGITGHSMGGHGALTAAMRLPGRYRSVSAFAPLSHPTESDWGRKQFSAYLGRTDAQEHDSTLLMRDLGFDGPVLIDQGSSDQFLDLLKSSDLAEAMNTRGQEGRFRMQPGYDHSYFFVSTFMDDHLEFHADALRN